MEIKDILTLIQAVDQHSLTELKLDDGTMKLSLKREEHASSNSGYHVTTMQNTLKQEPAGEIASDKVMYSPLVGTFYNASSPEAKPFVKEGDMVKKGQVLGIIEAMKLMNEIECEFDGVVEKILVDNEGVVEYGQPLFRIR